MVVKRSKKMIMWLIVLVSLVAEQVIAYRTAPNQLSTEYGAPVQCKYTVHWNPCDDTSNSSKTYAITGHLSYNLHEWKVAIPFIVFMGFVYFFWYRRNNTEVINYIAH